MLHMTRKTVTWIGSVCNSTFSEIRLLAHLAMTKAAALPFAGHLAQNLANLRSTGVEEVEVSYVHLCKQKPQST